MKILNKIALKIILENIRKTALKQRRKVRISRQFRLRRIKRMFFVALLSTMFLYMGLLHPTWAYRIANNPTVQSITHTQDLVERGKKLYADQRFAEAVIMWKQAISAFQANDDKPQQAMILGNLSLAYQKLGKWDEAQIVINQSLNLLGYTQQKQQGNHSPIQNPQILGQILDIEGCVAKIELKY